MIGQPFPILSQNTNINDLLTISRYESVLKKYPHLENAKLSRIQELKLIQTMIKDIKFVLTFDQRILQEQSVYWLHLANINDTEQRVRIKTNLETHCSTPVEWISNSELEITINPSLRIVKVPKF